MIDFQEAEKLVQDYLDTSSSHLNNELIFTYVMEKEYGWIFFYGSKRWIETEEINYAIAGNGPIVVENNDGSMHFLGTAYRVDKTISDYEERRHPHAK